MQTLPNEDGHGIAILANFPNAKLAATLTEFPIGTKFPDPADESSSSFKLNIDGHTVLMSPMQCQANAEGDMLIEETSYTWKSYMEHDFSKRGLTFINVYHSL